jgi:nitrile hydratase accessory protein
MSAPTPERQVGLIDGPAAPPRRNGELVFAAPWEGRVFGLAVAMTDRRHLRWDDFRERLVAEIAEGDAAPYYERWLAAFESLLLARGLVTAEELDARTAACAAEDDHDHEGHDHHDHDHDGHDGAVFGQSPGLRGRP